MDSSVAMEIEEIRLCYGGNTVLNGATATLRRGDRVLLRGENGSGKTSLVNILSAVTEPDSGRYKIRGTHGMQSFTFPRRRWQRMFGFHKAAPEHLATNGLRRS